MTTKAKKNNIEDMSVISISKVQLEFKLIEHRLSDLNKLSCEDEDEDEDEDEEGEVFLNGEEVFISRKGECYKSVEDMVNGVCHREIDDDDGEEFLGFYENTIHYVRHKDGTFEPILLRY